MKDRVASVSRETAETRIEMTLNLDGSGRSECLLEIGFLAHMLDLSTHHGGLDLKLSARGDTQVDDHHLVEDIGIVFGQALAQALGDKRGIERYGAVLLPMDDVLIAAAIDLSGRFCFSTNYKPERNQVGRLSTEMVPHFFGSLACEARAGLHLQFLNPGQNEHHRIEAMFKGFGRALRSAVHRPAGTGNRIPSTKGTL